MKTLKKVVIAPDSFKESLSALEVADAIECGFSQIFPQVRYIKLPMADGGEGTVESMVAATDGEIIELKVTGPLGRPVQAFYGLLGDGETAVIEMAAASGLHLVPNGQRDPRITTSYGTGELMLAALAHGVKAMVLGMGGSATNDGGAGMIQALGARLLDAQRQPLPPGGAALAQLAHIDLVGLDPRLRQLSITAACDVDNPLCGEKGASAVFGPQKGTTPQMVAQLDAALRHYGELMEQVTGREIVRQPGTGAAGGMGAALLGMLEARLRPGIEIVIEALRLEEAVRGADHRRRPAGQPVDPRQNADRCGAGGQAPRPTGDRHRWQPGTGLSGGASARHRRRIFGARSHRHAGGGVGGGGAQSGGYGAQRGGGMAAGAGLRPNGAVMDGACC